ncbi:MAG: LytR/AlgR family response regulator transcription factor [Woeseiaceae bacterium]
MSATKAPSVELPPLRAIVVDDESLARRGLEIRLENVADVHICRHCENGREAVAAVDELKPDLVFLDVQMPGMDGFETLRKFSGPDMPWVIFVTAFSEHAIEAFEANAIDYLLKPIDDQRLAVALDRVRAARQASAAEQHRDKLLKMICDMTGENIGLSKALQGEVAANSAQTTKLAIKDGDTTIVVPWEDVDWIESAGDYLCVHACDETHVMRCTMKAMEERLDNRQFVRVHRSTIINKQRVSTVRSHINGEYFLTLDGGKQVKVSRSYRDSIDSITGTRQTVTH